MRAAGRHAGQLTVGVPGARRLGVWAGCGGRGRPSRGVAGVSALSPGGLAVVPPLTHSQAQAAAGRQHSAPDTGPGVIRAQGDPGRALLDGSPMACPEEMWPGCEEPAPSTAGSLVQPHVTNEGPLGGSRKLSPTLSPRVSNIRVEFLNGSLVPRKAQCLLTSCTPTLLASPPLPSQLPALSRGPTGRGHCPLPGTACARSPESLPRSPARPVPAPQALGRASCAPLTGRAAFILWDRRVRAPRCLPTGGAHVRVRGALCGQAGRGQGRSRWGGEEQRRGSGGPPGPAVLDTRRALAPTSKKHRYRCLVPRFVTPKVTGSELFLPQKRAVFERFCNRV